MRRGSRPRRQKHSSKPPCAFSGGQACGQNSSATVHVALDGQLVACMKWPPLIIFRRTVPGSSQHTPCVLTPHGCFPQVVAVLTTSAAARDAFPWFVEAFVAGACLTMLSPQSFHALTHPVCSLCGRQPRG